MECIESKIEKIQDQNEWLDLVKKSPHVYIAHLNRDLRPDECETKTITRDFGGTKVFRMGQHIFSIWGKSNEKDRNAATYAFEEMKKIAHTEMVWCGLNDGTQCRKFPGGSIQKRNLPWGEKSGNFIIMLGDADREDHRNFFPFGIPDRVGTPAGK